MDANARELEQMKKRAKRDRQRILRVVEFLYFDADTSSLPVAIDEGYIVSDVEDYSIFASIVFKNISKKPIRSLNIRLNCYQNANVPYFRIPFEYNYDLFTLGDRRIHGERIKDKKLLKSGVSDPGETFGECVYIPIPESYFKRLEVELRSITFADGEKLELNTVVGKNVQKFSVFNYVEPTLSDQMQKYYAVREKHPVRTAPVQEENFWTCCCGYKNANTAYTCSNCSRERKWQFLHFRGMDLSAAQSEEEDAKLKKTLSGDRYKQNKYMEDKASASAKAERYNIAMRNIAAEERRKERMKWRVIPAAVLIILFIMLLVQVISFVLSALSDKSSDSNNGAAVETANSAESEPNIEYDI